MQYEKSPNPKWLFDKNLFDELWAEAKNVNTPKRRREFLWHQICNQFFLPLVNHVKTKMEIPDDVIEPWEVISWLTLRSKYIPKTGSPLAYHWQITYNYLRDGVRAQNKKIGVLRAAAEERESLRRYYSLTEIPETELEKYTHREEANWELDPQKAKEAAPTAYYAKLAITVWRHTIEGHTLAQACKLAGQEQGTQITYAERAILLEILKVALSP